MSSYRSYVPWSKSGLSSSYSGPSSSSYGNGKTSDSGISSTSQYDGGGYGRRLSSGSISASPSSSSYLSSSSYRPSYLGSSYSRGSTGSYLNSSSRENTGKEALTTSERRDSKDSGRMSLLDKYTSGTYPGRRDNLKEDSDTGSSSFRTLGRSVSVKSRDKSSRDPSPEPSSNITSDTGSKTDRVGYGTSLSPYRLYSRNTYSRSTSRDPAPDNTSSTSSTPATTPVHTPSSLRFSSSSRYGSNIIRSPVSEKPPPTFGLSSLGYSGKSVSRSNSHLESEDKKTSSDLASRPPDSTPNTEASTTVNAESSESDEDDDKSEEEIKQTTFITVVTRGTSPTPPSTSPYIRSRRSELARVIEKTITKPKSRPEMADKEIQSDRGDDTARLSRYGVSPRWASYLDRYPSAASSYSPVSRYSSRFTYTPRSEKDSKKSEDKDSSSKSPTAQDSSNNSAVDNASKSNASSVALSKDNDKGKASPNNNIKSGLSSSVENKMDSSNKTQLGSFKPTASKTEQNVTNISKTIENKETSDISSKNRDSTKVICGGSKVEKIDPASRSSEISAATVGSCLSKVKSVKNIIEKSEENKVGTDKALNNKNKTVTTSTLNSELISSKPKAEHEQKTISETEKEPVELTRVKSVKNMASKPLTSTGTESPVILRSRRSSSVSEGSSTTEGTKNSQEVDKEPPVLARIKSFKSLKSAMQSGNETSLGLKSKSSSSTSLSSQSSFEKPSLAEDTASKTEESKDVTDLSKKSSTKSLSCKPPIPNSTQSTETPVGLKNKSASSASLCSGGAPEKSSTKEGNLSRTSSGEGFLSKTPSNDALLSKSSSNEGLTTKSPPTSTTKSITDTANKLPPPVPKNDNTPGLRTSSSMHSLRKLDVANKDFRKSPLNIDISNALQAEAFKKMQERKFKRSSSTSSGDSEPFPNDVDTTPSLSSEVGNSANLIKNSKSLTMLHPSSTTSKISSSVSDLKDAVPKRKSPVGTKSRTDINKVDGESSESSSELSSAESSTSSSETNSSEDEDEGLTMKRIGSANVRRRPPVNDSKKTLIHCSSVDESTENPPKPPSSPKPATEDEPKSFLMRALAPVTNFFRGKQETSNENSTEEIHDDMTREGKSDSKDQEEPSSVISEKDIKKVGLKYKLRKIESGERAWWLESNPNIPEGIKRIESDAAINKLKDLDCDSSKPKNIESDRTGGIQKTPSITSIGNCKNLESDAAKPPTGEKVKKKLHRIRHQPSGELPWWLDSGSPIPEGVKRIESNTSINKLIDSDGDSKKNESVNEGTASLKTHDVKKTLNSVSLNKSKDSDQHMGKPPTGEDKMKRKLHKIRHQQSGELPWWLDNNVPVPDGVIRNASNSSVNKLVDSDGDSKKQEPDKVQGIQKTSSNSSLSKGKDSDQDLGKPPTGEDRTKKKLLKINRQQSGELDSNASVPDGIQKIKSNSSVNKLLDSDGESKRSASNKDSDSDNKKSGKIKKIKSNTSVKKLLSSDSNSTNKDDIRNFGYSIRKQESGEKAWWLCSSGDIPEGVKKLTTSESSEDSDVEEKKDTNSASSVPKFPLVLPAAASNGGKSGNNENSGRHSPYDNLQEQDIKPAKSTKASRPKNLPLFIGNHTNIDDILGTAVTLVNPVMGLSRLRKKLENQEAASSNEEDSGGEFSECEEVDAGQVRIHDSTAKKPQIKRLGDSTDGTGRRRSSGSTKLDDTALQLYKDGDYGSYLDLEASISEQQEEFDGFQTNRKNSIVLRTQLSVRVHTIIEKLLNSEGRELRRALFSLKQIFQEDKDLVHEFVQNDGLACLIKVGSEADQNYQNYILRALGQVMLYVDGMNGVMEHNETVQWLYALIASKFRLVVKTALKLLLVFVEYVETNCLLLIKAVHAVDTAHGFLPWSNIVKLLKDYDAADTELLIYAMTLVNKTLNGIPDQDTYYDQVDSLEEQGIEGTIQRYMSKQGTDLDLLRQFQIYEAVLHHEDGEEKGTPLKQLDETVRKTLRNRKSLTESMTAERRKSRRHSTGTSPMSSSLSTSARLNNSSLQNSTVADDDESESSSSRSSPGPELNGSYKESKVGDAGVTPALRRRRERAERQRSFIREQQETAATLKATLGSPDEGVADENVRLCQRINRSMDNGESRSSNKLQQLNRTSSRKDITPLLNAVNKMQDAKSGQESPEGNGILKKPWVLSMMYGKNSAEEGGEEALLDGENDLDDAASSEKKKILQLKRENTVKDLTQKLSSQNMIHSPVEEGNNKSINRMGDMTGLISKAKEGLAKSKSKEAMKSPTSESVPKIEPKKSETELHWEELVQSLKRPLSLCDLDFTDLRSDDEVDVLSPANITNGGPPPPPPVPMAPGMPSPKGGIAPPPPPPASRFGSMAPPPMPPSSLNPPPPFGVSLRSQRSSLGSTTSPDKSNTPPSTPMKKTKKTVKLFWKEVRDDPIILAKLQQTGMIWDELNPVVVDTQKLEHLFESRAKDLITKKQQEMNKNKEIIVLDHKRSNAINIGMTKLPPPRSIKTAILKMDATIMNREGIEKLLTMLPTEEERSKIQEAQVANPDMPLGSAEQFLLTLASISELPARLKLWAFKLDFENSEKEIAEPLMDLKQGMETLKSNKTFRGILSTLLSIGIFLNGNEVKGFQIEYLAKVPEVKDTVHKHSLLHHLCHMVMEKFSDSSDLYSEIGAVTRASKVDFDELAANILKLEQECKASWDHLKVIAKHDGSTMKVKMSDFLADCAERIIVLGIVHRRVMNRFHKFLLWLGIPLHRVADTKPNEFCRIVSEFALEYRTTRERVLQQFEKKANHRERNKTRGKMITEVGKFRTKEDRADAELRQLLGSDISEADSIHGTLPWRRQRKDVGRTVLSPLAREESVNGNLTDGDDEILESLVKTATKAPTTRTTPRERKRTRHADRKSLKRSRTRENNPLASGRESP